jgi:hypothetical protein
MAKKVRKIFGKWWKRVILAWRGIGYVMRRPRYLVLAGLVAILFAFILTLTANGTTDLRLLFSGLSIGDTLHVVGGIFVRTVTNLPSITGILTWLLAICQGVLIALLIFNMQANRKLDDRAVLDSSFASILAILGAGCPTCGTSLLMPVLTAVFSSAAYTALGVIINVILLIAFILVLMALRRLGFLSHLIMSREQHNKSKERK